MTDGDAPPGAGRLIASIVAGFVAGPFGYWGPFVAVARTDAFGFVLFLNLIAPALCALAFLRARIALSIRGRAWPVAASMLAGIVAAAPMAVWAMSNRTGAIDYFSPVMWIIFPFYWLTALALPLTVLVLVGCAVGDRTPERQTTKKVPGAYVLRE